MNQATNLIQWKNLTDEQKAEFDFEEYRYEMQYTSKSKGFEPAPKNADAVVNHRVYRLKIEPDKWYYWMQFTGRYSSQSDIVLGKDLKGHLESYDELRPATPEEIPIQPEIKEKDWSGDRGYWLTGDGEIHSCSLHNGDLFNAYEEEDLIPIQKHLKMLSVLWNIKCELGDNSVFGAYQSEYVTFHSEDKIWKVYKCPYSEDVLVTFTEKNAQKVAAYMNEKYPNGLEDF